jgi:hypothetical protein
MAKMNPNLRKLAEETKNPEVSLDEFKGIEPVLPQGDDVLIFSSGDSVRQLKSYNNFPEIYSRGEKIDTIAISDYLLVGMGHLIYEVPEHHVMNISAVSGKLYAIGGNLEGMYFVKGKTLYNFSSEETEAERDSDITALCAYMSRSDDSMLFYGTEDGRVFEKTEMIFDLGEKIDALEFHNDELYCACDYKIWNVTKRQIVAEVKGARKLCSLNGVLIDAGEHGYIHGALNDKYYARFDGDISSLCVVSKDLMTGLGLLK